MFVFVTTPRGFTTKATKKKQGTQGILLNPDYAIDTRYEIQKYKKDKFLCRFSDL